MTALDAAIAFSTAVIEINNEMWWLEISRQRRGTYETIERLSQLKTHLNSAVALQTDNEWRFIAVRDVRGAFQWPTGENTDLTYSSAHGASLEQGRDFMDWLWYSVDRPSWEAFQPAKAADQNSLDKLIATAETGLDLQIFAENYRLANDELNELLSAFPRANYSATQVEIEWEMAKVRETLAVPASRTEVLVHEQIQSAIENGVFGPEANQPDAHNAHAEKISSGDLPDESDRQLFEFVAKLNARGAVNKTELAREITKESIDSCPEAKKLCSRYRVWRLRKSRSIR